MKAKLKIRNKEDYVKHLLNHHEGEARFVGDSRWELFPDSGGGEPWNACYWSYQFVGTNETRKYLYERSQEHLRKEYLFIVQRHVIIMFDMVLRAPRVPPTNWADLVVLGKNYVFLSCLVFEVITTKGNMRIR